MEGTTWEGNADENAAKWRKLNRIEAWTQSTIPSKTQGYVDNLCVFCLVDTSKFGARP